MVNFVDSDGDIRGTNVQDAVNILNSGQINFETFSASGPSLAASTIEVNLITNYSGNAVVSPGQHGLNDPTIGSTVFINDSGPHLAFTGSSQSRLKGIAVGNITSTIVHESLHHSDGIGQAYNATLSGLNTAIGSTSGAPAAFSGMTPQQVQQVRNIVEEQIVRNAVDLIDTVSNAFARSGGRGYNDIQTIVDNYGGLLDPVQKA